ncbi:MAG: hypothetical protein ABI222_17260 [Opitutaceae bacterium]
MKIQTGPVYPYPYIVGKLSTSPALQPQVAVPLANPTVTSISPFLGAGKVHVFSPALATQSVSNDKVMEGVRAVTKLIASHCGQKADFAVSAVWLAVDGVSTFHTFRDAESSGAERAIEAANFAADGLALLGGVADSSRLTQISTGISFAALVGDHLHTGQITLSQSEIAAFSSLPNADEISNGLKVFEVVAGE